MKTLDVVKQRVTGKVMNYIVKKMGKKVLEGIKEIAVEKIPEIIDELEKKLESFDVNAIDLAPKKEEQPIEQQPNNTKY